MVTKDDFEAFLRKHRALIKFKNNISGIFRDIDDFCMDDNNNYEIPYISRAFVWEDTKEGHKYWYRLDLKWKEYVNNHK